MERALVKVEKVECCSAASRDSKVHPVSQHAWPQPANASGEVNWPAIAITTLRKRLQSRPTSEIMLHVELLLCNPSYPFQ